MWLGRCRDSNEAVIGTSEGVIKAHTTKRQSPEDQWKASKIAQIRGTPQQPNPNKQGLTIPIQIRFDTTPDAQPNHSMDARKETAPRRMMITKDMLDQYGYTEGCEACQKKRAGMPDRSQHSEECRQGFKPRMSATGSGKKRLQEAEGRINRRLEEELTKSEIEKRKTEDEEDQDKRRRTDQPPTNQTDATTKPEASEVEEKKDESMTNDGPTNHTNPKRTQREEEETPEGEPKENILKPSPNHDKEDDDVFMAFKSHTTN